MSEARHTAPPSRVSIWRHSDDDLEVYLDEWLGSTYYLRFLSGSSITRVVESGRWVQNGAGRVLEAGHLLLVLRKFGVISPSFSVSLAEFYHPHLVAKPCYPFLMGYYIKCIQERASQAACTMGVPPLSGPETVYNGSSMLLRCQQLLEQYNGVKVESFRDWKVHGTV